MCKEAGKIMKGNIKGGLSRNNNDKHVERNNPNRIQTEIFKCKFTCVKSSMVDK